MRTAALCLIALLTAGCHDYIVDPAEPVEPATPAPVPDLPPMTLKGPTEVTRGQAPMYKAGAIARAVRYDFRLDSGPLVLTSSDGDNDRYFYTEVAGEGQVEVRVTAYDINGEALAFARRWVRSIY
jgi:hypothetical protein